MMTRQEGLYGPTRHTCQPRDIESWTKPGQELFLNNNHSRQVLHRAPRIKPTRGRHLNQTMEQGGMCERPPRMSAITLPTKTQGETSLCAAGERQHPPNTPPPWITEGNPDERIPSKQRTFHKEVGSSRPHNHAMEQGGTCRRPPETGTATCLTKTWGETSQCAAEERPHPTSTPSSLRLL